MKTLEQIKSFNFTAIDGRDLNRLAEFIPKAKLADFDLTLKPEAIGTWEHKEFTRDNVLAQLKEDVAFGFEKALDQRGISAGLMHDVVRMWNWILEEGLEDFNDYAQYGLPLFKATAVKYGFDNPIGDANGDEDKFSSS
jgi:hypothetical protein